MSDAPQPSSNRRDFLSGRALRKQAERAGDELADAIAPDDESDAKAAPPAGGDTMRLATSAMACEFAVLLNPSQRDQIPHASEALEIIHACEQQMSVYRDDSEISDLNREACDRAVTVARSLFSVLSNARDLATATEGAFDPTSGPLIALWSRCRREGRVPNGDEITHCLNRMGIAHVEFDAEAMTVRFLRDDIELNLGGIGKGDALDRAAASLLDERGNRRLSCFTAGIAACSRGENTTPQAVGRSASAIRCSLRMRRSPRFCYKDRGNVVKRLGSATFSTRRA